MTATEILAYLLTEFLLAVLTEIFRLFTVVA